MMEITLLYKFIIIMCEYLYNNCNLYLFIIFCTELRLDLGYQRVGSSSLRILFYIVYNDLKLDFNWTRFLGCILNNDVHSTLSTVQQSYFTYLPAAHFPFKFILNLNIIFVLYNVMYKWLLETLGWQHRGPFTHRGCVILLRLSPLILQALKSQNIICNFRRIWIEVHMHIVHLPIVEPIM